MSENRVSIVLRSGDMEKFLVIEDRMRELKRFKTHTEVVRSLMNYYIRSSPLFR